MLDPKDQIKYLRAKATPAFKEILRLAYDPQITFDTPIPDYRIDNSPLGLEYNNLYQEYRRFYLFQPAATHVPPAKKSVLLMQLLESVHATEAMLIERIFRRDMSDYSLTEATVREAFPELLSPPVALPPPVETAVVPAKPKRSRKKATA